MSVLIVLVNLWVVQRRWRYVGGGGLVLLLLSSVMMPEALEARDRVVKATAVQAEFAGRQRYLDLVGEEVVDFIVLPEYAFSYDVRESKVIWDELKAFAEKRASVMVMGTRTERGDGAWFNTALAMDGDGEIGVHYKNHTVHFFDDGLAGKDAGVVTAGGYQFGMSICFDNDYEDVVRRMTSAGAQFFLVPSLDASHWTLRQHWQHAELFRHRAAENGRWMLVAAGSGVTQLIDLHGNRVSAIEPMTEGAMSVELEALGGLTLYTRFGWMFGWAMLVGTAVFVGFLVVSGAYRKLKSSRSGV
ncbi:nitrilase-related carbon-nitrogen hydrolase [Rubritalea tangerina]|uniref:Nitrilase-related carbon-nitrogen hydrolase n=2 Tax=Rubritalea tangerina TaxID=430798 RepID=A0ABW4ZC95_9BACT